MKKKIDEWDAISYPELTEDENNEIRKARRQGFAVFYPCFPDAQTQSQNTLKGAREFITSQETETP